MSGKMEKRFPPYQGREPYLYFCFSAADRKRVRPLLERMYARGTRVWYSIGKPRDLAERREREARMTGAALVVLYLTAAARGDVDFKNAALYCQDRGLRLLCIDADGGDSALSFGFTAKARHLDGLAVDFERNEFGGFHVRMSFPLTSPRLRRTCSSGCTGRT